VSTKMKVLLVQDVVKLGSAGEVKEVSGGYGRNYLIPQGFAVLATRGQIKQAEERVLAQRKRDQAARKDAEAVGARFAGQTLRFLAKVGEQERLYGSVTSGDIAERLTQLAGTEIDRRKILLDEPIKRIGVYTIAVRLMSGVEPVVNIVVEGEEGTFQDPNLAGDDEDAVG
jgi:large subunit ribosomal protein L9